MSLVAFRVCLRDGQGNEHRREVKINGRPSNRYTDETIYKEPGHHLISLTGPPDFCPEEQEIVLYPDQEQPLAVEFSLEVGQGGGGDHEA